MAVGNIGTYALFQTTLGNMNKVQGSLADEQVQLSSGQTSQDYAGIAQNAKQYLVLGDNISRINQYLNDNQVVESRLDTTSAALGHISDIATNLQNLLIQRRTGVLTQDFQTQLTGLWQQLTGQLNTELGGRYLFSGSKIDSPAVNTTTYPTLQVDGVPDSGYYTGSAQDVSARVQDNIEITYNVRADASGFQKIFAGLAMAKQGDATNDNTQLSKAQDMVQQGIKEVIAMQSTVNANKVQMTAIDTGHQSMKLFYQNLQDNIGKTDVLSVSTQVAQNQGVLQAAFQAFARISSLRLSDFLK